MSPDWAVVLGLTVCLVFGTYIQSTLGFGLNLLLTPFALLLLPGFVPVPALIVNGVVSAIVAVRYHRSIDRGILTRAMVFSLPGTVVGLAALTVFTAPIIGILGATVVLLAVATTTAGFSLAVRPLTTSAAGVVSGFLASTTSLTGPPLSVALHRAEPMLRRATIAASGVVLTVTSITGVALVHPALITDGISLLMYSVPGLVIGLVLAHTNPHLIPAARQRPAALFVAAAASAVLLVRSIGAL